MSSVIKMEQVGIGKILKDHKLKVPSHQREYSWEEDEVKKLFTDIGKAIFDNEPSYFLGTIATIPDSDGTLRVIDGQQRLATVTMLLAEIRNYLSGKDDFIVSSLSPLLEYPDRKERANMPKLRLNLSDNEFFKDLLLNKTRPSPDTLTTLSHRRITKAFATAAASVRATVSNYEIKDHGDILNKWIAFIEESAEVILLQMPSDANAFKMFETLNDRGHDMTQADMVKSYLFGEVGDRLPEAETIWAAMRTALEPLQDEKDMTVMFLRHALTLTQGHVTKEQIYEFIQKEGKGKVATVTLMRRLETIAGIYTATFFQDHERWAAYPDSVKLAIKTLNFFNIHPFRPVILAVAAKLSPKEAVKAFDLLVAVGVRLIIASSTRSGAIELAMYPVAKSIYSEEITTAAEIKKQIASIIPNDEVFRQAFEVATISRAPLARYYLRTLERVVKQEPSPWYIINEDKEEITLEHILPENPEGNWPNFTPDESRSFYRRLGNMVLHKQKINSDLKSSSFALKRPTYAQCPYTLTSQVAKESDWTKDLIVQRQSDLARIALEAWPI